MAAGPLLVGTGLITNWAVLAYTGGWLIFACAHALFVVRQGRLEIWPDGLTNRWAGRSADICWEKVERLVIAPTAFGRQVAVDECGGRRTILAAPRAGLLFDGRGFHDEVEQIRMMPGGTRTPPPVFTAPALTMSARLAQLAVVTALAVVAAVVFFG